MIVYPAIDIMDGKCVRLYQGKADQVKIYNDNPADQASYFEDQGAEWLHVVDLDGAFSGSPQNLKVVEKIAKTVSIPIELGGGLRSKSAVEEVFGLGVERAVLGTVAITNPELTSETISEYGMRIAVAIDARDGIVAIHGWEEGSLKQTTEVAVELEAAGVGRLIYTDISADGTLAGINLVSFERVLDKIGIPLIISGGVSSLADIEQAKGLEPFGAEGIIVGKALYEKVFSLKEAIEIAK